MGPNKLIQEFPNLQSYFYELVNETIQHQGLETNEHVEFYLVNLLTRFGGNEALYAYGEGEETPLALLFCQAQQENSGQKICTLKYLGDFALFISGYFQDSLNRKLVDLDYYISMGEGAYAQLSQLSVLRKSDGVFNEIFSVLASKFVRWMDVIAEVSEKNQVTSHKDLLRLYEKWIRTKSDRLFQLLTEKGIMPVPGTRSDFIQ